MNKITLSILTPAVPSRIDNARALADKLAVQIGDLPVEHLILLDNKRRTVGEKRDALLRAAQGKYISFVDDDDDISADYVAELLIAAKQNPDVITFRQLSSVDEYSAIVEFKLGNPHEQYFGEPRPPVLAPLTLDIIDGSGGEPVLPTVRRDAAHLCAWRRSLAIQSAFPPINYGEDFAFSVPLCQALNAGRRAPGANPPEIHIPKILHHYRHSSKTTEAPPGS